VILLALCAAFATPAEDRQLIGQLDREVIALKQKIEVLNERLATCASGEAVAPVYGELMTVLQGQHAVVSRAGARTLVTVQLDELFASDGARVREEALPLFDLLATAMKGHPESPVILAVYGDGEPLPPLFKKAGVGPCELTSWRAALVARTLVEQFGVAPAQLTAAGRGDQAPVATADTPEGRNLNRRLVVSFEPGVSP